MSDQDQEPNADIQQTSRRSTRLLNAQQDQDNTRQSASISEIFGSGRPKRVPKMTLTQVAAHTRRMLPRILDQVPNVAAGKSTAYFWDKLSPLKAANCPKRTASGTTPISIVNSDTFNAAIALSRARGPDSGRVAVLNMANAVIPGGPWLSGMMAQEEELCFRSSLSLSLHRRHYPFTRTQALYSPDVVVFRSDYDSGHQLLVPRIKHADLPVVSVFSVAATSGPATKPAQIKLPSGKVVRGDVYAVAGDRDEIKNKMRLTLRMAAHNKHGLLVLGALGCGKFRNPREDVALCWLEVFHEAEFQGGWWEEVWFAVFDRRGDGNYPLFDMILGGVEV